MCAVGAIMADKREKSADQMKLWKESRGNQVLPALGTPTFPYMSHSVQADRAVLRLYRAGAGIVLCYTGDTWRTTSPSMPRDTTAPRLGGDQTVLPSAALLLYRLLDHTLPCLCVEDGQCHCSFYF